MLKLLGEGGLGKLSSLTGVGAKGVWSIQVCDMASGAAGMVNGATLSFA